MTKNRGPIPLYWADTGIPTMAYHLNKLSY